MIERFGALEEAMAAAADHAAFFADPAAAELEASLNTRLAEVDVLSLDVFDTVLLRDGSSELERFSETAGRFVEIFPGVTVQSATMARVLAASDAYRFGAPVQGTTEGRLEEIAAQMAVMLGLPGATRAWIDAEMAVEPAHLAASPLMARLIAAAPRVVFLSDMYLEASRITALLAAAGIDLPEGAEVISSADLRVNKRSGTIFPVLAAEWDVEPTRILHIGDALLSDFRQPLAAGWQAQVLPVPRVLLNARADSHRATALRLFGDADLPLPMAVPERAA